jgi:hypothetical protein
MPSHFFVPDLEIFPQLEGLKLEADNKLIYVFDIDTIPVSDDSKHPMVSIFITDAFIGEEVNPEKKHHQAYTVRGHLSISLSPLSSPPVHMYIPNTFVLSPATVRATLLT